MGKSIIVKNANFATNAIERVTPSTTYYSISYNLTNATSSSNVIVISAGASYSITLTPNTGYTIYSATVTHNGVAVTPTSGYTYNIPSVSGNILVECVAVAESTVTINKVDSITKGYVSENGTIKSYTQKQITSWRYQKYSVTATSATTAYIVGSSLYSSSASVPAIVLVDSNDNVLGYYGVDDSTVTGATPYINTQISLPQGNYFAYVNTTSAQLYDIYLGTTPYNGIPSTTSISLVETSAGYAGIFNITTTSSNLNWKKYLVNAATKVNATYTGTAFYNKNDYSKEVAALQVYDENGVSFLLGGRDTDKTDSNHVPYDDATITLPIGSYYVYVNYVTTQTNGGNLTLGLGE